MTAEPLTAVAAEDAAAPFAPAQVLTSAGGAPATTSGLLAPFSEALDSEDDEQADAVDQLRAELEDEGFEEALEALVDEAAARHLRATAAWYGEADAPVDAAEAEDWLESLAAEADRVLGRLETHFADRDADSLRDGEMEVVSGYSGWESAAFTPPGDAQEQFFKKLLRKAKKVARGAVKVAKKGLKAVAKILPLGKIFGVLRRLVRPLLKRVLASAIGRLPASLQPAARRLAARFGAGEAEAEVSQESLAESFDRELAELALAADDSVVDRRLGDLEAEDREQPDDPLQNLDAARARLTRELAEGPPGEPPISQMEQFIPAVMAALPLVRTGIRIIGRPRVVNFLARAIAQLIKGTVGPQMASALGRQVADKGLRLLRLEAEADDAVVGAEALVAAAEETVRTVAALPAEWFADDALLEAEVQEAFSEAAARHLPGEVLRPEVVERESGAEQGFWLFMPRAARPHFRYKKYTRTIPVRLTRAAARGVVLRGGETLEHRLLDEAVDWPVDGELELYELLEGGTAGQLAAFESAPDEDLTAASSEFEELTATAAAVLAGNPRLAVGARRLFRLVVHGRPVRRRRVLGLAAQVAPPCLTVRVHLGEREAHQVAGHVQRGEAVKAVPVVRRLLDDAVEAALAQRLQRVLPRLAPAMGGAAPRLAGRLREAAVLAAARQLPAAAAELAKAAQHPAPGVTLAFRFAYPDMRSLASGAVPAPALSVTPGPPDE